jgi:hypothetical protein
MDVRWLLLMVCIASCDSGNENCPNQQPVLDWSLSTPKGLEFGVDRSEGPLVTFSIADAVTDLEGDPLFFIWYWEDRDGGTGAQREFGDVTMTMDICDSFAMRNAQSLNVVVAVSDQPLTFVQSYGEYFPIEAQGASYTMRNWNIQLFGECPL